MKRVKMKQDKSPAKKIFIVGGMALFADSQEEALAMIAGYEPDKKEFYDSLKKV
jgi:hypothetical protein